MKVWAWLREKTKDVWQFSSQCVDVASFGLEGAYRHWTSAREIFEIVARVRQRDATISREGLMKKPNRGAEKLKDRIFERNE